MLTVALVVHALLLPKCGEDIADCEDALAVASALPGRGLRAAIADGASSSAFSGYWARLLTQSFVAEPIRSAAELDARVPALARNWTGHVFGRDLPWHALERAARGAFAALAGVEVAAGSPAPWRGLALGDSCILHLRGKTVLAAAPIRRSRDFGNDPVLIATDAERNEGSAHEVHLVGGELIPGDALVLATDALAQFVLAAAEKDPSSLGPIVRALEAGQAAIDSGRAAGTLRNDDVAAIVIRVS